MRYINFLILFIFTLSVAVCGMSSVQAQEYRYRVELLVMRHLDGHSQVAPQDSLRDFSASMDLWLPATDEEALDGASENTPATAEDEVLDPAMALLDLVETAADLDQPVIQPPQVFDTLSDTMQESWRRLRLSAGFRPVLYRSWDQADMPPYPELRIHDDQVVRVDDPWALYRETGPDENPLPQQQAVPVFSDTGVKPGNLSAADGQTQDLVGDMELPDPVVQYRIDGTARLRKSRFLHLELDIEIREPLAAGRVKDARVSGQPQPAAEMPAAALAIPLPAGNGSEPTTQSASKPAEALYEVHRIRQSRQISTQRMTYFDGPVIGVLALVTRIEVPQDQPPDGQTPPPAPAQ